MKFITFVVFLIGFATFAQAQKENNVWMGGWKSGLDFNSGSPVPFLRDDGADFWRTNASICDKQGNLLFYTNGYRVLNKNLEIMQNGSTLEIGDYESWGYEQQAIPDGALILPVPGDTTKYYLFHFDLNYIGPSHMVPTHLFYSVVDMTLDAGLGGVVSGQKNLVLLADTLTLSGIKATKHANGRDYWLLCHEAGSNVFWRFLVDPAGIHGPYAQASGMQYYFFDSGFSTLCFNLDGDELVHPKVDSTAVELYKFDRCTGEPYDRSYFIVSDTAYGVTGIALSPSGQYLYATSNNYKAIWQFDLTASDIFASRQLAAWYSGALNPFPTDFQALRLGPDNKIYAHAFAYNNSLHVINNPDNPAASCGFVENAVQVNPPGWNWSGFPNTVNYSLGALVGSGCDTLTSTNPLLEPVFSFGVYPNPFANSFQLTATGIATNSIITVTNVFGQQVFRQFVTPSDFYTVRQAVDMSAFVSGVYVVALQVGTNRYSKTVVKR